MNRKPSYTASRFGHRVFGLLITLVVIPVAIASFAAVVNLEHELRRQAGQRLHQGAKDYGLSLLQRLSAVKREAALLEDRTDTAPRRDSPYRVFEGDIGRLAERSSRPLEPFMADNGTQRPALFSTGKRPHGTVYMLIRERQSPAVLEIDRSYLWGSADHLPMPELCVTGYGGVSLYCSTDTAAALLSASPREPVQALFDVQAGEVAYLGYARSLFLPSEFDAPEWTIHVFQTSREALSPATYFKYFFVPAIVALIAGTLLLGVVQIRRRIQPLQRLVAGARRVADQDFSTPVEVRSGDEFEDLAGAFNNMTRSLDRQFSRLQALSRIDKTILTTLDTEIITTHVLRAMRDLCPATCAALAVADLDSPDQGRLYVLERDAADISTERVSALFDGVDGCRHADGLRLGIDDLPPELVEPARRSGGQWCMVWPFQGEARGADGLLYLVFPAGFGELDSQTRQAVEDFRDRLAVASAAIRKEHLLQKQANFDPLTGLPNRFLLRDRLDRALIHARHAGSAVAILFLDLDRFKLVNDTLGHTSGDRLLVEAAERLTGCIDEGDTVGRLGGDEFVILLPDFGETTRVVATARRILQALAVPFRVGDSEMFLGASIGIALYPQDGENAETLLRNADTAMYEAKGDGRGRHFFFDHGMNARLKERARVESDLWRAINNDELELWYQPQIDLATRRVRGAEALIRWRHPDKGIVLPDEFIPVAEELHLIGRLGSLALTRACEDFRRWRDAGCELERIAVNVSPREFGQEDYVAGVARILERFDMPPLCLVLEITENLLVQDTDMIRKRFEELRHLGVSFSIDDFGIGYSSLSYLQKLPIDTLKIDRSFINEITANAESQAIVAAILDMAGRLDLDVVAEGVETQAQLDYLQRSGCRQIQGFVYSEPLHPSDFLAFLQTNHRRSSSA